MHKNGCSSAEFIQIFSSYKYGKQKEREDTRNEGRCIHVVDIKD